MDKETRFILVFLLIIIAAVSIVVAHTIRTGDGLTAYNETVVEDVTHLYNITVNNTDTTANITIVNITLPSSFWFLNESNGTGQPDPTFTNSTYNLMWTNETGFIINFTLHSFWFNATATTPGVFNISVGTYNNTAWQYSNISVVVNDTTAPTVTLQEPVNATSSTKSDYNFTFNVTDVLTVSDCYLIFGDVIWANFTSPSKTVVNGLYNESLDGGFWSVNCTDNSGNIGASEVRTIKIKAITSSVGSGSTGGASANVWSKVYAINDNQFKEGYTKDLVKKNKVEFKIGELVHSVGVKEVSSSTVKIQVASTPQEAVLNVGEKRKFEVTGDDYYDVLVNLNSITGSIASMTITSIREAMSAADQEQKEEMEKVAAGEETGEAEEAGGISSSLLLLICVVVIIVVIVIVLKKKQAI